ncbi:Protein of unknown function [Dyella sp. OK004]|uniref:DUF4238 domain-containing protein n=1 Tax=Dyella sp. OK004 TaxID=1855292 RepID=UPI0008E7548E|nr:DUF4238 domain-containing protein [Dyella sp. OK004]SFS11718.1 Protein of unknown function [Dyella sp. OK004]
MGVTRRQHYVWRGYLRAWASDDLIYCLRENKIFKSNLIGVAQERDFYKLLDLNQEEILYVEAFCNAQREPLRTTNLRWIKLFTKLFDHQREMIAAGHSVEHVNRAVDLAAIEEVEKLHGEIEQGAVRYLQLLRRGDASFFQNVEDKISFLYFLCVQYTRTKSLKARAMSGPNRITAVNPENVWNVLSQIVATSLGQSLIAYSYQLYFLRPEGEASFITGDQPVINVRSTLTPPGEAPQELDLYYPISPKLAVLVASEPPDNSYLSDEDVCEYNLHMQAHSHSQLFAHEAEILTPFQ